jgi:hypothetical protein
LIVPPPLLARSHLRALRLWNPVPVAEFKLV